MTNHTAPAAGFQLRPPRTEDLPALLALEQRAFRTDRLSRKRFLHWFRATNGNFYLCADPQDQPAGYLLIIYRRNSRRARLYSIVISEQYRGRGLARYLLQAGEQAAQQRHCDSLSLEVRPDNAEAIRLYQQQGYVPAGIRQGFYEDGSDALLFQKSFSKI